MPRFKDYVKKLPRHFQQVILDAVEDVLANPDVGKLKKGDLEGFRVHKFTMVRQSTLMAYKVECDSLVLYQVGPHENFYKNLLSTGHFFDRINRIYLIYLELNPVYHHE